MLSPRLRDSVSPLKLPDESARAWFRRAVLRWGRKNARDFFWRRPGLSPYEMLLVEIMVARTRAESVEPVAQRMIEVYPDPRDLASAPIERVEDLLRPLGLFRKRAKAMVQMAGALVKLHGGVVPRRLEELIALPYVGRYAANAVLCFGFGQRRPIVDANVARLFERFWGLPRYLGKLESATAYWELADALLPRSDVKLYNWSLLDLGGVVCVARHSVRPGCPLTDRCLAMPESPSRGSEA